MRQCMRDTNGNKKWTKYIIDRRNTFIYISKELRSENVWNETGPAKLRRIKLPLDQFLSLTCQQHQFELSHCWLLRKSNVWFCELFFFFSIYYCWSAVCSENQTLLWHFNDDMHHLYHHHHSTESPYTLPLSLISVETHKIEYKFCHKCRMLVLFVYHLTNLPSNEQNVVVLS